MKGSSSVNAALILRAQDRRMETERTQTNRRPAEDLLDVARALLLLQGAILVATTLEALIFGLAFPGAAGGVLLSGASAVAILVARTRLRAERRWSRRLVYVVEGLTLAFAVVDSVLAIALTRALPPAVAVLTQLVLPASLITLLRRSARATAAPPPAGAADIVVALGGHS